MGGLGSGRRSGTPDRIPVAERPVRYGPNGARLCSALRSDGQTLCRSPAMKGQTTCRKHGGASPQAVHAARVRLAGAADEAVRRLIAIMQKPDLPDETRLRAIAQILDRVGIDEPNRLRVEAEVHHYDHADPDLDVRIETLIAQLRPPAPERTTYVLRLVAAAVLPAVPDGDDALLDALELRFDPSVVDVPALPPPPATPDEPWRAERFLELEDRRDRWRSNGRP